MTPYAKSSSNKWDQDQSIRIEDLLHIHGQTVPSVLFGAPSDARQVARKPITEKMASRVLHLANESKSVVAQ